MKRLIVWIDCRKERVEKVLEKLKESLTQIGVRYTKVETCELGELEDAQ